MLGFRYAHIIGRIVAVAATTAALAGGTALGEPWSGIETPTQHFKRVRLFDFNEPDNYYDVPMHWTRFTGDGWPEYAEGVFDNEVGHDAPPSFRLSTAMENVALEYNHPDLGVIPGADYLIVGYIRAERVRHARAFLSAHFVNRFGDTLEASMRVSQLIQSTGNEAEPWQRVEILLTGIYPEADSLRLRAMLVQRYVWRDADETEVDPVIQQDIRPAAWFDDIAVYRLPRVELAFSNPGNVMTRGEVADLIANVHNATDQPLSATLLIGNASGEFVHRESFTIPPQSVTPQRVIVPRLPVGLYDARLVLSNGEHTLLQRYLRFAVLNPIDERAGASADMGVDIGSQRIFDVGGATRLVQELRCGLVRAGIPMVGALDSDELLAYYDERSALLRALTAQRIMTAGVILAPGAAYDQAAVTSTREMLITEPRWREQFNPVLAQHVGALISHWQIGTEEIELSGPRCEPELVDAVREQLAQFVSLPRMIVPQSVLAPRSPGDRDTCYWVPGTVSTAALPQYLGFLTEPSARQRWLKLDPAETAGLDRGGRLADLARRVVAAKALDPDRLIVPAPLELSTGSGMPLWQPTDEYIVLRTLFHHLAGKRGVGAIELPHDGIMLVFADAAGSCMVFWSRRPEINEISLDLYLGGEPESVDLWDNREPLPVRDGCAILPLSPTPRILINVDAPLTLLQASFHIVPTSVQINDVTTQPVLHFRNHYDQPLSGTVQLHPPTDWRVAPQSFDFEVPAGGVVDRTLDLEVPNRHLAVQRDLHVAIETTAPAAAKLEFDVPFTVGLHELQVTARARWQDDTLVVEQTLHNASAEPIDFTAFCQAPLRPRADRAFLNLAPGESRTQTYVFADAQILELAGMTLHLGLRENRGNRELDQLVEIPR